MAQVTEYRINPIDVNGDIIDPHFFKRLVTAKKELGNVLSHYDDCIRWEIERVVCIYEIDGMLADEDYTLIASGKVNC